MSRRQSVVTAAVVLAAIAHGACDRTAPANGSPSGTVTLVNRVSAGVRTENCRGCAAALEANFRQRLDAVDVSVGANGRTVDLRFPPSSPFASASFREAVADAGGEVQWVEIEACGTIDTTDGRSWITSGSTRLLLEGPGPFVTGGDMCVTGELQDSVRPPKLVAGKRRTSPS